MSKIKLRIEYDGIIHENGDQCVRTEYYKESEIDGIKKTIDSALKLQELVKERIKDLKKPKEYCDEFDNIDKEIKCELQSLIEENEK